MDLGKRTVQSVTARRDERGRWPSGGGFMPAPPARRPPEKGLLSGTAGVFPGGKTDTGQSCPPGLSTEALGTPRPSLTREHP